MEKRKIKKFQDQKELGRLKQKERGQVHGTFPQVALEHQGLGSRSRLAGAGNKVITYAFLHR